MEFVRGSDPVIEGARPGGALLDEVWAEGGALIDPGARRLVWFGGETTTLWGDDPTEHARRRPDLPWPTVTDADRPRHLADLERAIDHEPQHPAGESLGIVAAIRAEGRRVEANPAILEGRPSSGADDRKRAVIAALRNEIAGGTSWAPRAPLSRAGRSTTHPP